MSAPAIPHPSCAETTAHAVATRDRKATADLILDQATWRAVYFLRHGEEGRAQYELVRAGQRVERILGPGA